MCKIFIIVSGMCSVLVNFIQFLHLEVGKEAGLLDEALFEGIETFTHELGLTFAKQRHSRLPSSPPHADPFLPPPSYNLSG